MAAGIELLHAECRAAGRDPATVGVSVHGLAAADVDPPLLDAYAALGVTDLGVRLPLVDVEVAITLLRELAVRCRAHVDHSRSAP